MPSHTTIQGQAWDQIAKEKLGTEYAMHSLMAANLRARGVLHFSGNLSLTIPATEPTGKSPAESIPPWERNS